MSLPTIDVAGARRLLDQGAVLVDIRKADEHARESAGPAPVTIHRRDSRRSNCLPARP